MNFRQTLLVALLLAPLAMLAKDKLISTHAPEQPAWVPVPAGTFPMGALPGPDCLKIGAPIKAFNAYKNRDVMADEYQGPHWDEAPVCGIAAPPLPGRRRSAKGITPSHIV